MRWMVLMLAACSGAPTSGHAADAHEGLLDGGCGPGLDVQVVCDNSQLDGWNWNGSPVVTINGQNVPIELPCSSVLDGHFFYPWPTWVKPDDMGSISYNADGDFCSATGGTVFTASQGNEDVSFTAHCVMTGPDAGTHD